MKPILGIVALLLALANSAVRAQEPVVVFAAASLKEAFDEAALAFRASTELPVKISYAGSLALARQLEHGSPADVFIAADRESMDYAASRKSIRAESRFDFLSNRLVVIAPAASPVKTLALEAGPLQAALAGGRLAMGDAKFVPAGKYAKIALENLGLWRMVEARLASSENVRAALGFVAQGEAPLGIVYATDAAAEPRVRVVATIPASAHPPITYPVALTSGSSNPAAIKFVEFLRAAGARSLFERKGFVVLP